MKLVIEWYQRTPFCGCLSLSSISLLVFAGTFCPLSFWTLWPIFQLRLGPLLIIIIFDYHSTALTPIMNFYEIPFSFLLFLSFIFFFVNATVFWGEGRVGRNLLTIESAGSFAGPCHTRNWHLFPVAFSTDYLLCELCTSSTSFC